MYTNNNCFHKTRFNFFKNQYLFYFIIINLIACPIWGFPKSSQKPPSAKKKAIKKSKPDSKNKKTKTNNKKNKATNKNKKNKATNKSDKNKLDSKKKEKPTEKKPPLAKDKPKSDKDKHNPIQEASLKGITPFFVGQSILELNKSLKKFDNRFTGFKPTPNDFYYQKVPKLKGKKLSKTPLARVVGDKIYYQKVLNYKLITKIKSSDQSKSMIYKPKEIRFPVQKIHPQITHIELTFYDKKLYECRFVIKVDINEMNNLVELYHRKLGEKSVYDPKVEKYRWKKDQHQVTLNLQGSGFPRKITVQYTDLTLLESFWSYFGEVKKIIDRAIGNKKSTIKDL